MLDVQLASPQRYDALTIFPLVTSQVASLDYQLLADPGARVRIDELGAGTVPTLGAVNEGDVDVLLVDGEQLIGAKQNRMVNRSIVVPAHSKVEIPVSCIEQGRWHIHQRGFIVAPQHSPASVRQTVRDSERRRVAAGMVADAASLSEAQGEVWGAVAKLSGDVGFNSPTRALNEAYDARSADLEQIAAGFERVEGQIGVLAFVGSQPIGLDIIGGRRLYARLHHRMLRGWLMDALARGAFGRATPPRAADGATSRAAQEFLDRARCAADAHADGGAGGVAGFGRERGGWGANRPAPDCAYGGVCGVEIRNIRNHCAGTGDGRIMTVPAVLSSLHPNP